MIVFRCCCDWSWIVGIDSVFGPLWDEGWTAKIGHLMTREQWEDEYHDCTVCFRDCYQ